ncbi:branched-chain amino acid ABC transporter permease [Notoacmeibacter sp. MSK16QG-6]|uniref:branched-chain amino acid ABC transporter permease n=1 Tax=Notoacmeibacter sp. MSK16QG-6 TaxID=2957982 RepID=UPI00209EF67D|nr:branched-chain amino acid ABC transporter permease [Notoacmeibacter sp. MSK16QG-6]MCP1199526.1 branched-chain amino acid ABC transporter permease [Notoacmeibacter sp. MSK16QG-6]
MSRAFLFPIAVIAVAGCLAFLPSYLDDYGIGIMIGLLNAVILATAWALFSGPTGYISLATAAFFGVGAYTVAVLNESVPYPLILIAAAIIGALVSLSIGLATLRLAGIYFVIFTFGLSEMVRQMITWFEVNITGTLGRYIFLPIEPRHIAWQLLGLAALTLVVGWLIRRSKTGLALRVIGDDEVVAAHCGINIARVKVLLFGVSATLLTLAGAIQAPRYVYVEPAIVFNPTLSFLPVIMALLGGARSLIGPTLGAIPLFLLFEWLSASYPNAYSILLGAVFIVIVYALPQGVTGLIRRWRERSASVVQPEEAA